VRNWFTVTVKSTSVDCGGKQMKLSVSLMFALFGETGAVIGPLDE
jgi:hypothetical protein